MCTFLILHRLVKSWPMCMWCTTSGSSSCTGERSFVRRGNRKHTDGWQAKICSKEKCDISGRRLAGQPLRAWSTTAWQEWLSSTLAKRSGSGIRLYGFAAHSYVHSHRGRCFGATCANRRAATKRKRTGEKKRHTRQQILVLICLFFVVVVEWPSQETNKVFRREISETCAKHWRRRQFAFSGLICCHK